MCVCVFVLFFGVFFGGGGGGAPMCRVKLRTVKQGTSLKGIEVYGQSVVIIHHLFFVCKPFFFTEFLSTSTYLYFYLYGSMLNLVKH